MGTDECVMVNRRLKAGFCWDRKSILTLIAGSALTAGGLVCQAPAEEAGSSGEDESAGPDQATLEAITRELSEESGSLPEVSPEEVEQELFAPADTGLPGIELPAFRPPKTELVREGAFLVERQGYVHQLASGGLVFVFDADESGESEPPMIILPNLRTMEMRRVITSRAEGVTFLVNGQVFVYHGRNYLLPEYFRTAATPPEGGGVPDAGEAGAGVAEGLEVAGVVDDDGAEEVADDEALPVEVGLFPESEGEGRTVEDLLSEIERAGQAEGQVFRPPVTTEDDAGGGAVKLREGQVITARLGRLERGMNGGWRFVPDNDADVSGEDAIADAPITLLPCLNLEKLERLAQLRGSSGQFEVGGVVTVYEGRNYLMPTSFRVLTVTSDDLRTAQ